MKILMVTEIYLPIWGGAENQLRQLIPHLVERGCQVSIVTRRWHGDWPTEDVIDAVKVSRLGIPGRSVFATIMFTLSLLKFVVSKREQIDIIHSHGAVNMGAICSVMALMSGKRNVAKIATAGKIGPHSKGFVGAIILGLFKKSGAIISMTNEIDHELYGIGAKTEKIHRITNGVDVQRFHPGDSEEKQLWRQQHDLEKDAVIVLFSSRLVYRKGLDVLLEAWPAVVSVHSRAHLVIVGSGEDQSDSTEQEMRALVRDRKIPHVLFYGAVEQPESLLKVADVFVFPSRKEGFPNALMEAMAAGLPVLASDIGGVRPLIENGKTGFIFSCGNSAELGEKLTDVLGQLEKCRCVGTRARERMVKYHSFGETAEKYVSLYRSLLMSS